MRQKNIVIALPTARGMLYHIGYEQFYIEKKRFEMSALLAFAIVPGNMIVANKIHDWQKSYLISPFNILIKVKPKLFFEFNPSIAIRDGYFADFSNNSITLHRKIFLNYYALIGFRLFFKDDKKYYLKAAYVPTLEDPERAGIRLAFGHSFEVAFGIKISKHPKPVKEKSTE